MRHTTEIGDLATALRLGDRGVVSLVGGGGKTTALFALGRQLRGSVVLTTTTKMGADRREGHEPLQAPEDRDLVARASAGPVLAWGGIDGHRALGVDAATCDRWSTLVDHVVIEADGSRRRPFKAPAAHEPIVPASTTVLIGCVGSSAFDGRIDEVCHRPEIVSALVDCGPSETLTAERLALVLTHPEGTQKGRTPAARFVVVLHRVRPEHDGFVDRLDAALGGSVELVEVTDFS
ncbi:MAG: selenium cofactor biosynthesis protein YqeC [Actinomycetota bacterium]